MSNDFYNETGNPSTSSAGASALMRAEFALVRAAFDKFPTLTGNGLKVVRVNTGGTALEAVDASTLMSGVSGFSGTVSPSQITSNQNNYNPTGWSSATVMRLSTDASRNITGIYGGSAGRLAVLHNIGSFNFVLKDSDASSDAENRFALDADLTVRPDWTAVLQYDSTSQRWRLWGMQASAFIQTLLDDADAGAALTTLINGATEDTSPDKIADFIPAYDASATTGKKLRLITALARAMPFGQGLLINGKISTSVDVGSNALTVAVKGDDGNDPSSTNPVYALFRKSTLTDSGFDLVPIDSALSVVVSSGSTLGHASNIAQHIFVYLINNAGTAELAVSNLPPDYPGVFGKARLVSTTAEGGAGAADSATGVYSTTARSNVPWICVAKMLSTQTTAGTWAANMTQVDAAPFTIPRCAFAAYGSAGTSTGINTATKMQYNTELFDSDSTYDSVTNYRHQPNVAGEYEYEHVCTTGGVFAGASRLDVQITLNGGTLLLGRTFSFAPAGGFPSGTPTSRFFLNGTTDYVEATVLQTDSNPLTVGNANFGDAHFSGSRVPGDAQ